MLHYNNKRVLVIAFASLVAPKRAIGDEYKLISSLHFLLLNLHQVNGFLQHLNNQQPTIHFTMETEKDNSIPFLDTSVIRDSNGLLTTSVYRKPTHTDQYLAYDSHHPQSVKRGIVKCLYDRAKHLITKPSVISEEKKHLSSVLVSNGYPSSFI